MTPDDLAQLDDAAILDIVREAIDTDRVDLYLQPIVSLPQRKHRFYECFSRIRDRDDQDSTDNGRYRTGTGIQPRTD